MVVHLDAVEMRRCAPDRSCRRRSRRARLAELGSAFETAPAAAAARTNNKKTWSPTRGRRTPGPSPRRSPRRLVAQHDRHRPGPVAVDHATGRSGTARGRDLDQDLALAGRIEIDLGDREGLRLRIGRRRAHAVEHGGSQLHRCILSDGVPSPARPPGRATLPFDRMTTPNCLACER